MTHSIPKRLLVVRPDAYGDIVLFEPVLRLLREAWSGTELAVLIQERYADIAALVAPEVRWMTTQCDPYGEGPDTNPAALEALRRQVSEFAPDCVVAACYDKTWLEAVVAGFAPTARQICLGPYSLDLISKMILRRMCDVDWSRIYPEVVAVEKETGEWEKNLQLARYLTGDDGPARRPTLHVPAAAKSKAGGFLRNAGLEAPGFIVCCPAGTAKVSIKAWPPERFGEVVAWLEKLHDARVLLAGHENERTMLEAVSHAARLQGATPVVWAGRDGEIAVLAALLQSSRFFFGNDTGAMHMAAALDKPLVAVFGGGNWPRFRPAALRAVCVVQLLACFGCDWNCYFGDAPCVKTIPVDPVKKAIDRLLTTTGELREDMVVAGSMTAAELELVSKVAGTANNSRYTHVVDPSGQTELLPKTALVQLLEQLELSEADRAARLDVIQKQGAAIAELLQSAGHPSDQYKTLLSRLSEFDNQREGLLARLEKAQAELNAAEAVCNDFREANQRQSAELDRLRARVDELARKVDDLEQERARLLSRLSEQSAALDGAMKSLEEARARLKEYQLHLLAIERHWLIRFLKPCGLWPK